MISEARYIQSARELNVEVAAIKAVADVESSGSGFQQDGKTPRILFEPHIFWKELRRIGIVPENHVTVIKNGVGKITGVSGEFSDILYPTWGMKPYGRSGQHQHERLQKAARINRVAALKSCSWGKFQICGFNWEACGCKTLQEFINAMYESEDHHLDLFDNYILSCGLDDELRSHDWKGFARAYNGPLYYKHAYDLKLARAYAMYVGKK